MKTPIIISPPPFVFKHRQYQIGLSTLENKNVMSPLKIGGWPEYAVGLSFAS
ncbi:MAG: hypothetical protein L6437_03525 [Kiritimatiellae bacterium]|nr:hypothetical protein [Verrucomicrobiota bacterium]MCG2659301.1 hypothetical protein [Kiritimatiellia bacterium]